MIENGYIKLFRQLTRWEWYQDANTMRLFLHLLLTVNYEPTRWRGVEVPRGARCASLRTLCKELKMTERSVRTALDHLKRTGEITVTVKIGEHSIFSICNFEKYQKNDTVNDTLSDTLNDTPKKRSNRYVSTESKREKKQTDTLNDTVNDTLSDTPPTHLHTFIKEIKEDKEDKELYALTRGECSGVVDSFNSICTDLKKVRSLTDTRLDAIRSASDTVKAFGGWDELFHVVQNSDFLSGRSGNWNGCGFDWILKPDNLVRIIEGQYSNRDDPDDDQPPASYDIEEMERRLLHESPVYKRRDGA